MIYEQNRIIKILPLFLAFFLGLMACSDSEERRVLVVHSYEESYAAYPDFNKRIAEQFRKNGINADIRTVYLDCESYQAEPELKRMASLLDSVSRGWQPEVILVNEDQATFSLMKCGSPLAKKVPVVFAGVNYPNKKLLKEHPNVTGLHDKIDFVRNIELTKEIFGDNVRLFTILDSTYLDMQLRKDASEQLKEYKVTGFMDAHKRNEGQQRELVRKGYTRFVSIPVRNQRDQSDATLMWALGKYQRFRCYVQLKRDFTTVNIGNICVRPSFTMINEAFGYNEMLLGGYMTTVPVQAKEQVEVAVRILKGEHPSDIPIAESRKEYVFDWNTMKRNGLLKKDIPAYCKIINIPFSKQYPALWLSFIVVSAIFLITVVSCLLWLYLREQKRKKRALLALANEKETLALAVEGGTTYVWTFENNKFVFEDGFWLSLGMAPRKLSFKELVSFVHPDHLTDVEYGWRNLLNARKKIIQMRCDFNKKGYQWWEFRYTTKQLANNEYKTAGLLLNVQEMKDREEELEVARFLAEKAELKQSFLANMSHEIRTPLNSIVGFANILSVDEELTLEERQEYIDTINKNSDLLLKLVNDILELSRLESGYMSFSIGKCLVKDLINDVYMTHQVLIAPHLEFLKEEDDLSLEIEVDKDRLIQVLTNFLNNATKFTETGMIKLGYTYLPEDGEVCIYVEDTGCGIPREEQNIIFSRFYKQNEFSQGTGLGLSICKVIIEKLGGRIKLSSEAGKGSRFMVLLPCRVVS